MRGPNRGETLPQAASWDQAASSPLISALTRSRASIALEAAAHAARAADQASSDVLAIEAACASLRARSAAAIASAASSPLNFARDDHSQAWHEARAAASYAESAST